MFSSPKNPRLPISNPKKGFQPPLTDIPEYPHPTGIHIALFSAVHYEPKKLWSYLLKATEVTVIFIKCLCLNSIQGHFYIYKCNKSLTSCFFSFSSLKTKIKTLISRQNHYHSYTEQKK